MGRLEKQIIIGAIALVAVLLGIVVLTHNGEDYEGRGGTLIPPWDLQVDGLAQPVSCGFVHGIMQAVVVFGVTI